MYEYGAVLVYAWASESKINENCFRQTCLPYFQELMGWIPDSKSGRSSVTANLCGLPTMYERFRLLSASFYGSIVGLPTTHPLRVVLQRRGPPLAKTAFAAQLSTNMLYNNFLTTAKPEGNLKTAFHRFLRRRLKEVIAEQAHQNHLTSLIPFSSRQKSGQCFADCSLEASMPEQELLFKYRHGLFMFNFNCGCKTEKYKRGHEQCAKLPQPVKLTQQDLANKKAMELSFSLDPEAQFTDVDFLLNSERLTNAAKILVTIKHALRQEHGLLQQEAANVE